jgi:hemerythrin-like metal-binding protein
MEWSQKFSVGIPVFDDEHKKLIVIINDLHGGIAAGTEKEALQRATNRLIEYTILHFQHEEMYFEDWVYPEAAQHAAMHAELKRKVFAYRSRIEQEESSELAAEMLRFLRDWLAQHILVEDKKFGAFLFDKGLR